MIYVNGDSYSAPEPNFNGVWSDYLNVNTLNKAIAGSSNDRIIRTTIEDILRIGPENINKVIIGFSFFMREEVWWEDKLVTLNSLLEKKEARALLMDKLIDLNINHQMVHHYTYIWMLSQTLENLGINYLFFSAADNTDFRKLNWEHLKELSIYHKITENEKIINLHNFNIPKWGNDNKCNLTETGHFADSLGHEGFAKFLIENYL